MSDPTDPVAEYKRRYRPAAPAQSAAPAQEDPVEAYKRTYGAGQEAPVDLTRTRSLGEAVGVRSRPSGLFPRDAELPAVVVPPPARSRRAVRGNPAESVNLDLHTPALPAGADADRAEVDRQRADAMEGGRWIGRIAPRAGGQVVEGLGETARSVQATGGAARSTARTFRPGLHMNFLARALGQDAELPEGFGVVGTPDVPHLAAASGDENTGLAGSPRSLPHLSAAMHPAAGTPAEAARTDAGAISRGGAKLAQAGRDIEAANPVSVHTRNLGLAGPAKYLDPQWLLEMGGPSALQFGAQALLGKGVGALAGPAAGTAAFASSIWPMEVGNAQREIEDALLEQGMDPDEATRKAAESAQAYGVIAAALEHAPGALINEEAPRRLLRRMIVGAVVEGSTEAMQQAAQNAMSYGATGDRRFLESLPQEVMDSGVLGAVVGAGATGVFGAHAHEPDSERNQAPPNGYGWFSSTGGPTGDVPFRNVELRPEATPDLRPSPIVSGPVPPAAVDGAPPVDMRPSPIISGPPPPVDPETGEPPAAPEAAPEAAPPPEPIVEGAPPEAPLPPPLPDPVRSFERGFRHGSRGYPAADNDVSPDDYAAGHAYGVRHAAEQAERQGTGPAAEAATTPEPAAGGQQEQPAAALSYDGSTPVESPAQDGPTDLHHFRTAAGAQVDVATDYDPAERTVYVHWFGRPGGREGDTEGRVPGVGPVAVRQIVAQLGQAYPEAQHVKGWRVSGAGAVPMREQVPGLDGREYTVRFSDGKPLRARYRVVEAGDLTVSHNPDTFARNPAYPEGVQGRDYHRDRAAQEAVAGHVLNFDPEAPLSISPSPNVGPAGIRPDGTVIWGHGRSMMLERVARDDPEQFEAYRQALAARAESYGIDPEAVHHMERPVLVAEVVDKGADLESRHALRELNARSDQEVGKVKDALSDANTRAQAFRSGGALALFGRTAEPEQSLREYLGTKAGREFTQALVDDGVFSRAEMARYIDMQSGVLNAEGMDLLEDTLFLAAVGDVDAVAAMPKALRAQLEAAISAVVRASAVEGWGVEDALRGAIRLHIEKRANAQPSIAALTEQGGLFGREDNADAVQLATFLEQASRRETTEAFQGYAADAEQGGEAAASHDLFGEPPPSPEEAFARRFTARQKPKQKAPRGRRKGPGGGESLALGDPDGPDPYGLRRHLARFGKWVSRFGRGRAAEMQSLEGTRVVDERGRPRVVFHGTGTAFDEFAPHRPEDANTLLYGPGYYFTENPEVATGYAKRMGDTPDELRESIAKARLLLADEDAMRRATYPRSAVEGLIRQWEWSLARTPEPEGGPNVRVARLAIAKPFDVEAAVDPAEAARLLAAAEKAGRRGRVSRSLRAEIAAPGATNESVYQALARAAGGKKAVVHVLKAAGYDGITHMGGTAAAPHRVWIAFERGQVHGGFGAEPAAPDQHVVGFPDQVPARMQTMRPPDPVLGAVAVPISSRMAGSLTPTPGVKPTSAPAVIKALARVVEVAGSATPLRVGRIAQRSARGIFKVREEVIRVREANNIPTSAHEVGHALEKALYGWPQGTPWVSPRVTTRIQRELADLGHALYGSQQPAGGYRREGWAEFVRTWVTESDLQGAPADLRTMAPELNAWFEGTFSQTHPEVRAALDKARDQARRWRTQGSVARGRQGIVDPASPAARVRNAAGMVRSWLTMERLVEMAAPIERVTREAEHRIGRTLDFDESPYLTTMALRMTHASRTSYMVEHAMIDLAGNPVGPPLADIRALVRGRRNDFMVYLWARRAMALLDDPQGARQPGLAREDAQQILDELGSTGFELAASKVYEWNDGVLSYAAQASPTFAEVVERTRERDPGDYVPLQREFEEMDARWRRSAGAGRNAPVKRLEGSGRRIKDPFQAMIAKTEATLRAAHERFVVEQLIRLADEAEGLGGMIEEVPVERVPGATVSIEDLVDQINRELAPTGGAVVTVNTAGINLATTALTFFTPARFSSGNDPIFPVSQQGRLRWFQVDAELYRTLQTLDIYRLPLVLDWLFGKPARLFRAGTTGLRASFGLVWNPLKDAQTFYVNTQSHRNPAALMGSYLNALRAAALERTGLRQMLRLPENAYLDAFIRLGGEMAQPLGADIPHTRRAARRLFEGTTVRTLDPRNWFDWFREVVQVPESVPRVAELREVARQIGWRPGEPMTLSQSMQLLLAAKQVTTDFTAAGEFARVMNQIAPFHNAAIQGPRAHVRAMVRNPRRFWFRAAQISALSFLLWLKVRDKDWYKALSYRERVQNWHFPLKIGGRQEIIRIPRSFELGAVSAIPEVIGQSWEAQDPASFWQFAKLTLESSAPNVTPVLLDESFDQYANRDRYFDRPIVPMGELRRPPEEQYGEYTSRAAVVLGGMFKASPRRVDHAIRGVAGAGAADLLEVLGLGAPGTDREKEPADWPVVGRLFVRGGSSGTQPQAIEDMYDEAEKAQRRAASKRHPETTDERNERLLLADATKAVSSLMAVREVTRAVDQRRALTAEADRIATEVMAAVREGPPYARGPMRGERHRAERQRKDSDRDHPSSSDDEDEAGGGEGDDTPTDVLRRRLDAATNGVARLHRVPDVMRDLRPGANFLGRTGGATFGRDVFLPGGPEDSGTLAHEYGHVFENAQENTALVQAVLQKRPTRRAFRGRLAYAQKSGEYFASAFEGAVRLHEQIWVETHGRGLPDADAEYLKRRYESQVPGTLEVYDYLTTLPAFATPTAR